MAGLKYSANKSIGGLVMPEVPLNPIMIQRNTNINTGKPLSFLCPNCSGIVTIKALGHSITAVCAYCSSIIDVANENFKILQTAHDKTRPTLLTLGSKGVLSGILWEVIGYMEKSDHTDYNTWDEYLLFNPYHGFRFLVQSNGHWSLYKVLKQSLGTQALTNSIQLNGQKYQLFLKGFAKVTYVKGEFYWRVQKGERTRVYDYIAPPQLLSIAQDEYEINLALGTYLPAKTVAKAFTIEQMPHQSGVAPNLPGRFALNDVWQSWLTALLALLLATLLQLVSSGWSKDKSVFNSSYELTSNDKTKTIASDSFNVPKQTSLSVASFSPLENDWLELDLALVNDQGQEIRATKQALELYSGISYDGYHWKEGNQTTETLFSAIPKGNYRLLIDADSGSLQNGKSASFSLSVKYGVKSWSNYWYTTLLIVLYPIYVSLRYKFTEWRRWSESDLPFDAPLSD
jgi:hypothetical protein